MIITNEELLQNTKLTNQYVIRQWGLLWNIRMVAEANGVSEQTVKDLLKAGRSLATQLKKHFSVRRRCDLNTRKERVIISKNGIDFSWNFLKFILMFNDPDGFEMRARGMKTVYRYWLKKDDKQHTEKNFLEWLNDFLSDNDRSYWNARYTDNGVTTWDILRGHYERYQKFDKNKLRISKTPIKDIWDLAKRGPKENDPNERFYELSPRYHQLMRHLPEEHIPEMVAFMLLHPEYKWLQENK